MEKLSEYGVARRIAILNAGYCENVRKASKKRLLINVTCILSVGLF